MSASVAQREPSLLDRGIFSITFWIESRLEYVRLIRAALSGVLSHLQVEESDIHSLALAVSEIVNNSFEHGYNGAEDKSMEVRVRASGEEIQIDLRDEAPQFPEDQRYRLLGKPLSFEETNEEWTMRGHGLQIVRQLVDSVELEYKEGQNCITLRKHVVLLED